MNQELWMGLIPSQSGSSTALSAALPVLERYGLSLTDQQVLTLQRREEEALRESGRIELGDGILPKLLYAFCDSPYLDGQSLTETLSLLLDTFYYCKNEAEGMLSDDELVENMMECFNGTAHGSAEYMAELTLGELLRCRKGLEDNQ